MLLLKNLFFSRFLAIAAGEEPEINESVQPSPVSLPSPLPHMLKDALLLVLSGKGFNRSPVFPSKRNIPWMSKENLKNIWSDSS